LISVGSQQIDSVAMVYIEPGPFTMGSDLPSAKPNAKPAHKVELNAYWLYQNEVTNKQYLAFVQQTNHAEPAQWKQTGGYPAGRDKFPVVSVSWDDADAYCRFAGKRLPTEAEWEKAARGVHQLIWPWGNEWDSDKANGANQGAATLQEVGSHPAGRTPYGADDMAGNAWEWVQDWYDADYYSVSPLTAPTGPALGQTKIMRGGAWPDDPNQLRTFTRVGVFPPDYASDVVGFRCACTGCRSK
jgi:sulfatase modifying factor 1